jgi:hypothetical protein
MFGVAAMIQYSVLSTENSTKSFFGLCFLTRDVVSSFSQIAVMLMILYFSIAF